MPHLSFYPQLTRQLAAKGNTVYATARKPSEAAELQQLAQTANVHVTAALDVSSPASIAAWAADLKTRINHVDLLINNAGILEHTGLRTVDPEEMMRLFQINTMGPLFVTQSLHNQGLLGRPGTSIVANMTSKMGSVEDNGMGGYYSYRASKAALNIINKSLSIDLASEGVTSVLLHPGFVKTEMTGNSGNIDAKTSAAGLLSQLESGKPLQGRWYGWNGEEIPW